MIRLSYENENLIKMEIKMNLPYENIFAFLQKRGYEVKNWLWKYEDETFPNGKTNHESWTFTATKPGEEQSEKTLFLTVLEMEFKQILKEI
jgi:hypothetical protein